MKTFSRAIEETEKTLINQGSIPMLSGFNFSHKLRPEVPFWDFISLATYLKVSPYLLAAISQVSCNNCYSKFFISKDTHEVVPPTYPGKVREINAPCDPLKSMQKELAKALRIFPIHSCNNGFISGKNIVTAVEAIQNGETLIHIDIEKFFDNHSSLYVIGKIKELFLSYPFLELDKETLHAIESIVCKDNKLPQGSPISPLLVVILNYDMDERIQKLADEYKLTYARYADDLAFSGVIDNPSAHEFIRKLSFVIHPFKINFKKIGIMRHSAKPVLDFLTISNGKYFTMKQADTIKTEAKKVFSLDNLVFTDYLNSNNNIEKIIIKSKDFENLTRDVIDQHINELKNEIADISRFPIEVKTKFWYIQHKKSLLGMNVQNGTHTYPRRKYEELRLQSMLAAKSKAINEISEKIKEHYTQVQSKKIRYAEENAIHRLEAAASLLALYAGKNNSGNTTFRNLLQNPIDLNIFNGLVSHIRNVDEEKSRKLQNIFISYYNKTLEDLRHNFRKLFSEDFVVSLFNNG